jgi:hypothetical protein
VSGAVLAEPRTAAGPKPAIVALSALAGLIAAKIGVLLAFGPTAMPDTSGYVAYADHILDGTFRHVDLVADPMPITLLRIIGYPAIIAGAKIVGGEHWAWVVVLLQFTFSIIATVMLYRLARALELGLWWSLGVAAAEATAMQFVVDQAILSDSICASAMTIAICLLGLVALHRKPVSLFVFFGVGLLLVMAYLMRDVIEFMALGLLPLVLASAFVERTRLERVVACLLVFLPLVAAHLAYIEWNRERVGAPVVSTIAQATLFAALEEAAQYDQGIFSGSDPFDDAGRRAYKVTIGLGQYGLGHDGVPTQILHRDYGWDAVRISHEATMAYLRAWWQHPYAMIRHVFFHVSETQLHQAVRPTETIHDMLLWNTGNDYGFAQTRAVRAGNWWMIPAVILHFLVETVSVAVFSAFLVVTPIRLFREGWTAETSVSIGCLCAYLVVGGLYSAVHLEPRYLTPVVPGSIVIGVAGIAWLVEEHRRSRGRPAA